MSEEEWFPLRMDIDRRWEEVEEGNPNPWVATWSVDLGPAFIEGP